MFSPLVTMAALCFFVIAQGGVSVTRPAYFSATFFSTSSIRVCHPGPVALK